MNFVFQVLDSGDSLSVELAIWNPIVNGVPDSKAQDSRFS